MKLKIDYPGTIARWLPKDPAIIRKCHHELLTRLNDNKICLGVGRVDEKQLSLVILEFKQLIEEDPQIFRDFHDMFDQVPKLHPAEQGNQLQLTNYMELLAALDDTIASAPPFKFETPLISGVPMYILIAFFCNTEAGYRAFTNDKVNAMIHKMFDVWARHLVSPASRQYLTTDEATGWLGVNALKVQQDRLGMSFQKAWVCDPDKDPQHWGFTSWDDFFVRRFREGVRPTIDPDNSKFINCPCEAIVYRYATDIKATDRFWLKDLKLPYSLEHVLSYDPLASQFVGGTIYQAILSSMDYHRWHSHICGRVVKAYVVPGTYYAAVVDDVHDDIDVVTRSMAFQAAVCTRAYIYIESDNPDIGLTCFVGVGLVEVSTCKLAVREGDRVEKGDEIGSFHFGGSTYCLVFRPQTKLSLTPEPTKINKETGKEEPVAREVGTVLFHVDN